MLGGESSLGVMGGLWVVWVWMVWFWSVCWDLLLVVD